MELYFVQGADRQDCELKIAEKYKRPFHIQTVKEVRIGGFLGLFSKPGVEVGFYFSPVVYKNPAWLGGFNTAPDFANAMKRQYMADQYSRNPASLEEEKRKVIAAAGKSYEQTLGAGKAALQPAAEQQIIESLKEIKEKIETAAGSSKPAEEHPAFARSAELLRLNDFSEKYISRMLEKMRKELPMEVLEDPEEVQQRLLEWIGESISIYREEEAARKPRIMVLVGPTGVGKTTTLSKLAAIYGIGTDDISAVDVRMITIDAFRICAKEQLQSIGNIMQIPVSCVDNKAALRREIALHSEDTDMFLIDTIGKSPKDASKLGEMKEILDGCPKGTEYHLVLSSGTKSSDIENIMRQFEPFNYRSVILTKIDETERVGNIISALAEKGKPVSYLTDGQSVPNDIRKASVVRFLINLEGFNIDREKMEKRFPSGEAEQFKWR
jgi:flagellar biosynthesis protein FlhF